MFIPSELYITFPVGEWMKFGVKFKCCREENGVDIDSCASDNVIGMELYKYDIGVDIEYC